MPNGGLGDGRGKDWGVGGREGIVDGHYGA